MNNLQIKIKKNWKLRTFDLSYILGNNYFSDDVFQNIFAYQPTLDVIFVKEVNSEYNVITWIGKQINTYNLTPLYNILLIVKCFNHKIAFQFYSSILAVEKRNY